MKTFLIILLLTLCGAPLSYADSVLERIQVGTNLSWSVDTGSTSPDNIQRASLFSFKVVSVTVRQDAGAVTYLMIGKGTGGYLPEEMRLLDRQRPSLRPLLSAIGL